MRKTDPRPKTGGWKAVIYLWLIILGIVGFFTLVWFWPIIALSLPIICIVFFLVAITVDAYRG